jgi:hypothetical protein
VIFEQVHINLTSGARFPNPIGWTAGIKRNGGISFLDVVVWWAEDQAYVCHGECVDNKEHGWIGLLEDKDLWLVGLVHISRWRSALLL